MGSAPGRFLHNVLILFGLVLVAGCATGVPSSRLGVYLGSPPGEPAGQSIPIPSGQMRAGLVVITDTGAPDAAPALPDEAVNRLAESLQKDVNQFLPIVRIDSILSGEGINPGDLGRLRELGAKQGFDFLAVAVLSGTEQEYPMTLFLGWTSHAQPGYRRDNWSLAELALLETRTGRTVLRAEGRGMATLDRPSAPGINQWYPVIYLRPQDPERRWWPPTYAGAPNTLRVVAMNQAVKRLVMGLQDAWIQKRQSELAQAGG
jgi:hypothetical protein